MVRRGTSYSIYVDDGEAEASGEGTTFGYSRLFVGRRSDDLEYTYFDGIIDDIRVYANALSQAQIANLYAAFAPAVTQAPTRLSATAVTSSQVNLSWNDKSNGEYGFRILRKTGSEDFSSVGAVAPNTTVFRDIERSSKSSYSYRVVAYGGGKELSSNEASVVIPAAAPVFSCKLQSLADNRIMGLGKAIGKGKNAEAQAAADNASQKWSFEDLGDGSYKIVNLANGQPLDRQGASRNMLVFPDTPDRWALEDLGQGIWAIHMKGDASLVMSIEGYASNPQSTNIALAFSRGEPSQKWRLLPAGGKFAPGTPYGCRVQEASTGKALISWIDNSDSEQGFSIESKVGNGSFSQVGTVGANVTTWTSTGLTQNPVSYTWRVRAYSSAGNSYYSNEARFESTDAVHAQAPVIRNSVPDRSVRVFSLNGRVLGTYNVRDIGRFTPQLGRNVFIVQVNTGEKIERKKIAPVVNRPGR